MASYHCEIKIIGRSDGRSVVAAAAYRAGTRLVSAETGVEHDYRRKGGVGSTVLMMPPHARPEWQTDRNAFWNAVEAKESRKNSQLAREFTIAIPHELSKTDGEKLVYNWVRENIVARGIPADVCIHDPKPGKHGNRNWHAHILTGQRGFDPDTKDGWATNRNRDWNKTALLKRWRESWATAQNDALIAARSEARVDHRSLKDQHKAAIEADDPYAIKFDRPPEPVMGIAASAIERRARAIATRRKVSYKPVTERGQAVAKSRSLRATLQSAISWARKKFSELRALQAEPDLKMEKPKPDSSRSEPEDYPLPELRPDDDGMMPM